MTNEPDDKHWQCTVEEVTTKRTVVVAATRELAKRAALAAIDLGMCDTLTSCTVRAEPSKYGPVSSVTKKPVD